MNRLALLALLLPLSCGADPPAVYAINEPLPGDDPSLFGGAGGVGGEAGAAGQNPVCDGSTTEGIEVAALDLYRYPPYAASNCALLYLAPTAEGAELRRRDLTTGQEETLAPASEKPTRPTIAGATMAWEATESGRQVVRVRRDGATTTVAGNFVQATEPRATSDAVVFTAWKGLEPTADTDVLLYLVGPGTLEIVQSGPGQQRFADVSPTHVAFSDFSEDPDGAFDDNETDLADLVLLDRASGALDTRKSPGKQAFPLLGSPGTVVFLAWPEEHPEPKLTAYGIQASALTPGAAARVIGQVQQAGSAIARPSSQGGQVTWVAYEGGASVLRRVSLAEGSTPEIIELPGAPTLFAPTAGDGYTLIATRPTTTPNAPLKLTRLP
jgi:hypothetical protein